MRDFVGCEHFIQFLRYELYIFDVLQAFKFVHRLVVEFRDDHPLESRRKIVSVGLGVDERDEPDQVEGNDGVEALDLFFHLLDEVVHQLASQHSRYVADFVELLQRLSIEEFRDMLFR